MIQETITKLETRLQNAAAMDDDSRRELLALLARLKSEVTELSKTNADQAQSITGFTVALAHEATRAEKQPELLDHSLQGLAASVEGFEETHPNLVQVVNRICTTLSSIGI
jgi:hypothetical protein